MTVNLSSVAGQLTGFSRTEINQLFKKARRVIVSPVVSLLLAPRQAEFARILLVIPRKVGTAPERNKIKRRVRAIFYQERLYEQSKDCVFIARKGASDLSFEELQTLLMRTYQIELGTRPPVEAN